MCLSFKLTGVFLALMLFLVCADWISEDPVPVVVQSTHSPAWCSWRLRDLDAFLDSRHLFLCISGLLLPPMCVWLHIWPKERAGVMFLHVWEHLDQAMEETQEEIVNIYWAQIFTCGVDGNKYGDADVDLVTVLDIYVCRRGKGKDRWCYLCFLPSIVLGFRAT